MDARSSDDERHPDCPDMKKQAAYQKVVQTFDNLENIWVRMGLPEDDRLQRTSTAIGHVTELLDKIVAEEKRLLELVLESKEKNWKELQQLQGELQMFLIDPGENLSLIDAEEKYRLTVRKLKKEKSSRISMAADLVSQLTLLYSQMGESDEVPSFDHVPGTSELETFKHFVNSKRRLLESRTSSYLNLADEVRSLATLMNYNGNNSFERFAIECKGVPPVISAEVIGRMKNLVEELKVKFDEYVANIDKMCEGRRGELSSLYEKCKLDPAMQQSFSRSVENLRLSEKLEALDSEVERLRNYYGKRHNVLEKFEEWEQHWSVKLELEEQCKDSSRFANRGGVLLHEEKMRRTIERKLNDARHDVQAALEAWHASNPDDAILVYGKPPLDAIEAIESSHAREVELELSHKKLARKAQLQSKARFGSVKCQSTPKVHSNLKTPSNQKNVAHSGNLKHSSAARRLARCAYVSPAHSPVKPDCMATMVCNNKNKGAEFPLRGEIHNEPGPSFDKAKSPSTSGCSS
uniref:Protein regulator of cytokinesis 1 n=1 Tax=Trichuris muris TaxID=70415 RepID=A0A5S6QZZ8_TRIMR